VIPARASTFDEVKGQIKDAIVQPRLLLLVQDRARELIAKATSAGGDLAKAAKAAGFDVKTSAEFARDGNVEGVGSASYLQEGFIKPEGTVFGPISTGDGAVVAKVVRKVAADPSKLAEQRAQIRDDIKGQKARDRNALFESGLKQDLLKSGKLKIYQDVVTRIISSYRAS
jgi:peptidyl-prolyl cis-trans isomerase D